MKPFNLLYLFFLFQINLFGQTPHLNGNLEIDLDAGLIHCDFQISNFPALDNPALCLNKGFNIKDLRVDGLSKRYNVDWGVAFKSPFLREGLGIAPIIDSLKNEQVISLKYVGAFPRYQEDEITAQGDGMSVIAIKNEILRASHQSLWYPVLMDRTTNTVLSKFTYDLSIECTACQSIYLGGSDPQEKNKIHLSSSKPNDLILYAGRFDFKSYGNTFFLNTNLDPASMRTVDQALARIRDYYAGLFGIPYEDPIVLAQIFSIGPANQYENWAFVVYPCIVADLNQLSHQIDSTGNNFKDIEAFRLYSHELAHQYFGLQLKSDNEYWAFFSESLAEYLSLKAMEEFFSEANYHDYVIHRYLSGRALERSYVRLDSVQLEIDTRRSYRYYPMLMLGLEQCAGKDKTLKFLKYMLHNVQSTDLNYEKFKQEALKSGILESEWEEFESSYVQSDNCLRLVRSRLE